MSDWSATGTGRVVIAVVTVGLGVASAEGGPRRSREGPPPRPPFSGPVDPPPGNPLVNLRAAHAVGLRFRCSLAANRHEVWRRVGDRPLVELPVRPECDRTSGRFTDRTVVPETRYCYRVRGRNNTHHADSDTVCLDTPVATPAAPIVWLVSAGANEISVLLRDQSVDEHFFRIHHRRAGDGAWSLVAEVALAQLTRETGDEIPYLHQGLAANTEYEYRVEAGYRPRDPSRSPVLSSSPVVSTWTRRATPASDATSCATSANCSASFALSNGSALTYWRNYPIDADRAEITRAVLVVHGLSRNAQGSYKDMVAAAKAADVLGETLVVSPLFAPGSVWSEAWKEGGRSAGGGSPISSFAVADELILAMTDPRRFPNLREVVVAGHSGGGQFAQRYAATSGIDARRRGLRFRYVVVNPSSYLYLNDRRPSGPSSFALPRRCPEYDDYKYGLRNRNQYASRLSADEIRAQYPRRRVVYLLGGADNDRSDDDLDTRCAADLQGTQRLARGTFYYNHLMRFFPENRHRKEVVPAVAHERGKMFRSAQGQRALFF